MCKEPVREGDVQNQRQLLLARAGTISLKFMPPKIKLHRKELKEKEQGWIGSKHICIYACINIK